MVSVDVLSHAGGTILTDDGFATNPWKADTDADGVADGLESNGWSWSGSTILADVNSFRTDPTHTDTDYDGLADGADRWPLQDAYVHVYVNQFRLIADTAQTDSNVKAWPYAILRDAEGGTTISKAYGDVACNPITGTNYATCPGSLDQEYSLDLPDTSTAVTFTLEFWQDATRFGFQNDVPASIASPGSNVVTDTWTVNDDLSVTNSAGGVDSERWYWSQTIVSAGGADYKNWLRVLVTAHGGLRSDLYLVVPDDYAGIYNVTDPAGVTVARRYVGETRFVTVLVNGTDPNSKVRSVATTYLVPRSVFFDTAFYRDLQDASRLAASPYTAMKGYQNNTTSSNSDDLQMAFAFDGLDDGGRSAVRSALETNATGAANHVLLRWTGPDWSSVNSPYLVGLPADAIRSVPLVAWYSSPSHGENVAAPPPLPFWVRLFTGDPTALEELLRWVYSGLVTVANLFVDLGRALVGFGSWLGDLTSGDPVRVASAVKAAQRAFDQVVDAVSATLKTALNALLGPLLSNLVAPARGWGAGLQSLLATVVGAARSGGDLARYVGTLSRLLGGFVLTLASAITVAVFAAYTIFLALTLGITAVLSQVGTMIIMAVLSAAGLSLLNGVLRLDVPASQDFDVYSRTITQAEDSGWFTFTKEMYDKVLSLILGALALLIDTAVAWVKSEPSLAAFLLGLYSFLFIYMTFGLGVPFFPPDVVGMLRAIDAGIAIAGLAFGVFAVLKDPIYRVLGVISLALSGFALYVDFFGGPTL